MKNKQPEKKLFHSYCRKIQESIEGINSTFLSRSVEGQSQFFTVRHSSTYYPILV